MRPFKIEIYSDVVCPWCFVGKRKIEETMRYYREAHPDERQPEIVWMPFLLNTAIPKEGLDRKKYMQSKFPEKEDPTAPSPDVIKAGREVGLEYRFDKIERQPYVIDAHRLIRYAEHHGPPDAHDAVVESLFQAYFINGEDVSRHDLQIDIAARAGMDADKVRTYLNSEEDVEWVKKEAQRARDRGIDTVPFLVLNGRRGDSAIQPVDALLELVEWARRDAARPRWMPSIF
jgi:predicted DsbA family dithiol-disulfide isomerase